MKKFAFIVTLLLSSGYLLAQTAGYSAPNVESYKKKIKKSEALIQNPKKNAKTKTWISRGDLFVEIGTAHTGVVRVGMDATEEKFMMGRMISLENKTIGDKTYEVHAYEGLNLLFFDGKVALWEVTTPICKDPLFTAYDAYAKVIELDKAKKTYKSLAEKANNLRNEFVKEGSNYYSMQNYKEAAKYFEGAYKSLQLAPVAKEDTIMAYYAAVSAQTGGNHELAVKYFKKSIELDYAQKGNTYLYLNTSLQALGDTVAGVNYLKEGFLKFPDNNNIIGNLINYYITKGENADEVLRYVEAAIKNNPDNGSLYQARGTLLDKMGKKEDAKEAYKLAIKKDPNSYNAAFNLGVMLYNVGVELNEEATKIPPSKTKEYNAKVEEANVAFKESLPYFEQCLKIKPNEVGPLETIKNITFRLRNSDPEMKKRYEEVKKMLEK
ncbi:MAG: tetratricopeptide repeat protein [Bacteroidales bacterium]|jgi:tetratricopeptide (TPR) repeat protein|nr:tetratricopeptide repeat protein [Bacteroidales bacterium]